MEEKESTASGSPGNSDTDSPTPVSSLLRPEVMDMNTQNTNYGIVAESVGIEKSDAGAIAVTSAPGSSGGSGGLGNAAGSGDLFVKKKRGRPRKYDADGNLRVVQPLMQHKIPASAGIIVTPQPSVFSLSPPPSDQVFSSSKRGRGRPPGSGNWQLLASLGEFFANTAGGDFTPHVVTVYTGEDVARKILSFSQNGQRGICVLSANGAVSNVTIRQPGSSGGILTYEGRFEILSLSGSFTVAETGGVRSRTGGLSISLAGADGRVIGGGVAGLLLAASPIQIVVGSFLQNGYKAHKRRHQREQHVTASVIPGAPDTVLAERPISQAKSDAETFTSPEFPSPGQRDGGTDNCTDKKQIPDTIIPHGECWNGREPTSIHRPSPDINLSLPSEEGVF